MFIDVTRHGGGRRLRVAVAAIAYLDACEGAGAMLHLVGGEVLRVGESVDAIEDRIDATIALSPIAAAEPVASSRPTLRRSK